MSTVRVRTADGPVIADVVVPPSKSITNRALVCAALADGESEVVGLAPGDDSTAMIDCLEALGIAIGVAERDGRRVAIVGGTGGDLPVGPIRLDARLAGTTSRFITAVAALGRGPYVVDGEPPLRKRPMAPLHESLHSLGAVLQHGEERGHLPVTITGPVGGADALMMPGDVSSQYVSALMLIAPLIRDGMRLGLSTKLVSRPYVEITKSVMQSFGATGVEVGERRIHVDESAYVPTVYDVEPDASSASYPLAAAAMAGGAVTVRGLGRDSLQGDAVFVDVLERMGCRVVVGDRHTVVTRRPDEALTGLHIDMADISDLVPTMAVLATQASSPTRITGVGFIRRKESDRLGDLAAEMSKTGASVEVEDDGLLVTPVAELRGARLATHHDHRLAMAFGLLGLVVDGIEVADPDVVTKSWPDFWDALDAIPARPV